MTSSNRIGKAARRLLSRGLVLGSLAYLVVTGAGCDTSSEGPRQRATAIKQALVGRDGTRTINAAATVVNAYAALNTGASAGATAITVADIATLSTGFSTDLSQGDLLLIVQMAGATINTTDTAAYGTVTALGNAGRYEFAGVEAVNGNQITLACALKNSYSGAAGKVQVVRVPQYTTLTITSGGSITAPAWNGTTGGVVAVHAESTLQLDGQINVSAKGFRGGAAPAGKTSAAAGTGVVVYRSTQVNNGAEKGEGIAGYQSDYGPLSGRYGRGAAANAGGGGNSHNAGGGGGANARSGLTWNGQGVMLASVTGGATAWPLDPGYALATPDALTNSEGGGRGGYSYSLIGADPLTSGPDDETAWGGDGRREVGGLGGHALDNDPSARLFLGGGGGAGDGNNDAAGRGGNGGGLVFIIAGVVSGAGSILANGEAGEDANSSPGDAPGGGGGGGTIVVHAVNLSSITIAANGGPGGNHTDSSGDNEVEGPGGGGGGGYIAVSGGTPTMLAQGGLGGTTNRASMTTFPSDGATAGNAGQTNGSASVFVYCATTEAPDTRIASQPDNPSTSATGTFAFEATQVIPGSDAGLAVITDSVTFQCNLDNGGWSSCPKSYTTPTLGNGSHTLSVRATDLSSNTDGTPAVYAWTVQANTVGLDAGGLDVGVDSGPDLGALDSEGAQDVGGQPDVLAPFLDAPTNDDVAANDDVNRADVPGAGPDLGPGGMGDVAMDAEGTDVQMLDGAGLDGVVVALDGGDAMLSDAIASVPEPGPDAATVPGPDTAPIAKEDAAIQTPNPDAAVPETGNLRLMGGGFCSVAARQTSTRTPAAPYIAALLLLGCAAAIRRRRR